MKQINKNKNRLTITMKKRKNKIKQRTIKTKTFNYQKETDKMVFWEITEARRVLNLFKVAGVVGW